MSQLRLSSPASLSLLLAFLASQLLGGCASDISSQTYTESHVGEASTTYQGIIQSVRPVTVSGGDRLSDNSLGIALGALAGGLAGSTMGGGKGNLAMTGIGAVAGGTAGSLIEKGAKKQNALEYVVMRNDGALMTVVQSPENPMAVGQKVFVILGRQGRSRIVPAA